MPNIIDQILAPPAGPGAAATPAAAASPIPPAPGLPSQPCSCGFRTFWLDSYDNWHCEACRPPKMAFLRRRTITLDPAGKAEVVSASDEQRLEKFIEVIGSDGCIHLVHRDCLDPRSDYFDITICQKISLGIEAAERDFFSTNAYLSEVLAEKNSIDRLPGPWPQAEINYSELPDENANLPKNKKYSRGKARGRRK